MCCKRLPWAWTLSFGSGFPLVREGGAVRVSPEEGGGGRDHEAAEAWDDPPAGVISHDFSLSL